MNAQIFFNKDFGKVSTSKKNTANKNIERIMSTNSSADQKANAIIREFENAYKGTGLEGIWKAQKKLFKEMIQKGQAPNVNDANPWKS